VHGSSYCFNCETNVLTVGTKVNHLLHLVLSFLTFGVWIFVWIFLAYSNFENFRCSKCGLKIGEAPGLTGKVPESPGLLLAKNLILFEKYSDLWVTVFNSDTDSDKETGIQFSNENELRGFLYKYTSDEDCYFISFRSTDAVLVFRGRWFGILDSESNYIYENYNMTRSESINLIFTEFIYPKEANIQSASPYQTIVPESDHKSDIIENKTPSPPQMKPELQESRYPPVLSMEEQHSLNDVNLNFQNNDDFVNHRNFKAEWIRKEGLFDSSSEILITLKGNKYVLTLKKKSLASKHYLMAVNGNFGFRTDRKKGVGSIIGEPTVCGIFSLDGEIIQIEIPPVSAIKFVYQGEVISLSRYE